MASDYICESIYWQLEVTYCNFMILVQIGTYPWPADKGVSALFHRAQYEFPLRGFLSCRLTPNHSAYFQLNSIMTKTTVPPPTASHRLNATERCVVLHQFR